MLKAEGGGAPTAVHTNRETAIQRAKVLAVQLRTRVFLLEATALIIPVLPKDEEIPVNVITIPSELEAGSDE